MRLPARRLLALSVASGVLGCASPLAAQGVPPIPEPGVPYEYASPAPEGEVEFRSAPMVQELPVSSAHQHAPRSAATLPPLPAYGSGPAYAPPLVYAPSAYAPPAGYAAPYPPHGYAQAAPSSFDRTRWLADCRDRIRGIDRKERAGVIGGLLGAITGGVIGNRAWHGERLAGTLLGGGIGGLAGLAIGSAIGAAGDRREADECAWYLDRYMAGPGEYTGYGYGYPGYGYAGYALVPVLVAVPQRQVVRQIVTEEWVEEPVRSRAVPRRYHRAAPPADKRIKLIKGQ